MQAGLNIADSKWHDKINLVNIDLQSYFPDGDLLFDVIITNPPFFINSLLNPDAAKARARHSHTLSHHELLEAVLRLMTPSGSMHLVLPVNEADKFIEMAAQNGLYCQRRLYVKPTPLTPSSRVLMTLGYSKSEIEESTIVIEKGGRHHYSDEYVSLTKDFYLKF
jgi:tRNA1Val (adenine37-N6)-methyltransferase